MILLQGGDGLLESMKATSRNVGLLNIARQRMNEDRSDKLAGIKVRFVLQIVYLKLVPE